MQRDFGYARLLATGAPAPSATVTVYAAGTLNLSTIFDDDLATPTPRANPFTADTDGFFYFYAVQGRYDVQFSGGGIPSAYAWGDIRLNDTTGFSAQDALFTVTRRLNAAVLGGDSNALECTLFTDAGAAGVFVGFQSTSIAPAAGTWSSTGGLLTGGGFESRCFRSGTGKIFGLQVSSKMMTGATGGGESIGMELDIINEEQPTLRFGLLIAAVPDSSNPTLNGKSSSNSQRDAAIAISNKDFGAQWQQGLYFFDTASTRWPISSDGALIRALPNGAVTMSAGIDFSSTNLTFTDHLFAGGSAKFNVDGSGRIGLGTASPATSAFLEISSTTKALLLSRMTTAQRNALTGANGMVIYNTTTNTVEARENGVWVNL